MNKKIIGAFMISVFVGLGYVGYRKSTYGRNRKAKSIVDEILEFQKASSKKWEFPQGIDPELLSALALTLVFYPNQVSLTNQHLTQHSS